jgi:hypothetical protein
MVGQVFSTGNAVVRTLKAGTILEVVGNGQLEIVDVPTPQPGDRIETKYGTATVVRRSDRIPAFEDEGEILYVADSDPVVRRLVV